MRGIDIRIDRSKAGDQGTHGLILQHAEGSRGIDVGGRRIYIFIDICNGDSKSLRISQITIICDSGYYLINIIRV